MRSQSCSATVQELSRARCVQQQSETKSMAQTPFKTDKSIIPAQRRLRTFGSLFLVPYIVVSVQEPTTCMAGLQGYYVLLLALG